MDSMDISEDDQESGDDDGDDGTNDQEVAAGGKSAADIESNLLGHILREVHLTRHQFSERITIMRIQFAN